MVTLNFVSPIRASGYPSIPEAVRAKLIIVGLGASVANAIFWAFDRLFFSIQSLLYKIRSLLWCRHIAIDLLILPKLLGDVRPILVFDPEG